VFFSPPPCCTSSHSEVFFFFRQIRSPLLAREYALFFLLSFFSRTLRSCFSPPLRPTSFQGPGIGGTCVFLFRVRFLIPRRFAKVPRIFGRSPSLFSLSAVWPEALTLFCFFLPFWRALGQPDPRSPFFFFINARIVFFFSGGSRAIPPFSHLPFCRRRREQSAPTLFL